MFDRTKEPGRTASGGVGTRAQLEDIVGVLSRWDAEDVMEPLEEPLDAILDSLTRPIRRLVADV